MKEFDRDQTHGEDAISKRSIVQQTLGRKEIQRSSSEAIDARAPPPRPHVAVKLKKCQRESERARAVVKENFALLQRLNAIMKLNRLDNKWVTPQPDFHHKVGVFFPVEDLVRRLTARSSEDGSSESQSEGDRVRCYACHHRKKFAATTTISANRGLVRSASKYQECLPPIYL